MKLKMQFIYVVFSPFPRGHLSFPQIVKAPYLQTIKLELSLLSPQSAFQHSYGSLTSDTGINACLQQGREQTMSVTNRR